MGNSVHGRSCIFDCYIFFCCGDSYNGVTAQNEFYGISNRSGMVELLCTVNKLPLADYSQLADSDFFNHGKTTIFYTKSNSNSIDH